VSERRRRPSGGRGAPDAARAAAAPPGFVRIIGGRWKRSRLPVTDAPGLRPTPDRVRETVFNWLGQDLTGRRCLDAFAGAGALGFEAASRGAAEVVLIERDRRLAASLTQTAQRLEGDRIIRVVAADAIAWMARAAPGSFDVVFLDPPFDSSLAAPALAAALPLVADRGLVYVEGPAEPAVPPGWALLRSGRAGAVQFGLIGRVVAATPA
jgi:16S rRNA (guanine(966)-N(2))-methyltransferase RsmD